MLELTRADYYFRSGDTKNGKRTMWPWGQKSVRWLHRRPRAPASVVRGVLTSGHGHSLAVVEAVECSTHPDGHEVVATISTEISTEL